jgi:hypothetical protein
MPKQRIPLVGSNINRPITTTDGRALDDKDQRFENCYPELYRNAITGGGTAYVLKRLGTSASATGPGINYRGMAGSCLWAGYSTRAIAVFPIYGVTGTIGVYGSSGVGLIGDVLANMTNDAANLSETMISNDSYLTLVAEKSTDRMRHAWYLKERDAAWTEITSANFPPNINGTAVGGIATTTLTTTSSSTGVNFPVGTVITGSGVTANTKITAIGTAVAGVGTYTVSISQTVSAGTTISGGYQLVGKMVHMDGYAFVMDIYGTIWNSDLNSLANWTSTSFINASKTPDGGIGLARMGTYVVAFGTSSIEYFQNTGNATGSPLTRVAGLAKNMGAAALGDDATPTILEVDDSIYFIGFGKESQNIGVFRLIGTEVQKVSNAAIDRIINLNYGSGGNFGFAGAFSENGMTHILMSPYSTQYGGNSYVSETPVYCHETKVWWFRKDNYSFSKIMAIQTEATGTYFTYFLSSSSYVSGLLMLVSGYTEKDVSTGAATAFEMQIRTTPIDHGTDNLKEFTGFTLIADTQTTAGTVSVSHSNNDYTSFSTPKTIDMTVQQKKLASGLGWGRRRSWKITETVNRPFRAEAIDIEWEVSEE